VIRRGEGGEGFAAETMRLGFPPPPNAGAHYVTNVRNTSSGFWKRWLTAEQRCLVPATAFAEYGQETPKREHWFARTDGAPIWFAGIWREWEGVRGTKKEPVTGSHRLFAFLTCEPNAIVAPVHPKAMPVILGPNEADAWLSYPTEEALKAFQRPLPDDQLVETEKPDA
jgi:putative SOS response-associated peptidase YedK